MAKIMILFEDNPDGSCSPKLVVPKGDPQEVPAEWKDRTVAQSLAIMAIEYLQVLHEDVTKEYNARTCKKEHSCNQQVRPGH